MLGSRRWRGDAPARYHVPMPRLREFVRGPWRAVAVLGVAQILAWGTLFYPPVLTMPLIAADLGWSIAFCMSGLSIGLMSAGLAAPTVGRLIDRYGGGLVMTAGSLVGAAGLFALAHSANRAIYLGVWVVLGISLAASLYDASFATLGRIFGPAARRPITLLTFAGGFASTVSWPATHVLLDAYGWRTTYLVYAGLLAFVAAPLHGLALPRQRAEFSRRRVRVRRRPSPCCRREECRSSWWRPALPPIPSCRRACRRTCSRSSAVPASMPARR